MSRLHGKQIKDGTVKLDKLNDGTVTLTDSAVLRYDKDFSTLTGTADEKKQIVVNKAYVDQQISTVNSAVYKAGNGIKFDTTGDTSINIDLGTNNDAFKIETNNNTLELKNTITGDRTFNGDITISNYVNTDGDTVGGNLTVDGNLTVSGSTTTINTAELTVEDKIITLAKETPSDTDAGIEIERGTDDGTDTGNALNNAVLTWDSNTDLWYAGITGSSSPILTEAGDGLISGADSNIISIDLNGTQSGLVSTGGGLKINIDNDTIKVNSSNQLYSISVGTPVYQSETLTNPDGKTDATASTPDYITGITLTNKPTKTSRIQLLVNGLQQELSLTDTSKDAYFSITDGGTTPINTIDNIMSQFDSNNVYLVWRGDNAGFELSDQDVIELIYETE